MSDVQPPDGPPPSVPSRPEDTEPTTVLPGAGHAEGDDSEPASGRRTAVVAGVTALTLAVVAGGAFAAVHFLGGGPQAEKALPAADTLAVVSLDLDPSAKQKVEAIKTLQRFPALKQELKLSSGSDLRKKFFDDVLDEGKCKQLSYDKDIKPWIGDNLAVAAASFAKGKVSPLIALAVTDQDKAKTGLKALLSCSGSPDEAAFAFHDDFALITDTQAHADQAVKDARAASLSDDAGYQDWTGKVGDRGVANFYVAKRAATYLADNLDRLGGLTPGLPGGLPSGMPSEMSSGMPSGLPSDFASGLPSDFPSELIGELPSGQPSTQLTESPASPGNSAPYASDPNDAMRKALANFKGAAGALRFADGGAELEVVGGGVGKGVVSDRAIGGLVSALPGDTTAVFGLAVATDFAKKLSDTLRSLSGMDLASQLEARLGITVPGDLESLLGEGLALSLRGTPPDDLGAVHSPQQLPIALTIKGDAAKIKAVIAKIEARQGGSLADGGITVKDGNGKVTMSFDAAYAEKLVAGGGDTLGDNDRFKQVVPDADKASAVVYLDFDTSWRQAIAKEQSGNDRTDFLENTAPLKAFGLSSWSDGGDSHLLLKLSTD